jgi:hypothetical protein
MHFEPSNRTVSFSPRTSSMTASFSRRLRQGSPALAG